MGEPVYCSTSVAPIDLNPDFSPLLHLMQMAMKRISVPTMTPPMNRLPFYPKRSYIDWLHVFSLSDGFYSTATCCGPD
jgi:hypothetical protein